MAGPVWTKPRPGLAPRPTMTAWQMPYRAVLAAEKRRLTSSCGGEGVAGFVDAAVPGHAGAAGVFLVELFEAGAFFAS